MIEVCITYNIVPGADLKAYGESAKRMIGLYLKAPGFVEFRANRNLVGSPRVRATCVWRSTLDWGSFFETDDYSAALDELSNFMTDVKVDVWGPSPVTPEPLRPGH